jgi:putative FmdB family regulatory protein
MRQMFDFSCKDCGDVMERLVNTSVRDIECECGGKATRIMSMPTVKLDGISGDFPGAYNRWASIREERARSNSKKSYVEP